MATKLTPEIITAAILGFEDQKRHIDVQIAELKAMLSGGPAEPATAPERPPKKRKISALARRRMALGQKARWAKIRGESEPPAPATPEAPEAQEAPKPKRRISEEGMKRIIAATKRRWRLAKAAKAQPATAKKTVVKKAAAKKAAAKKGAAKKGAPAGRAAVKTAAPKAEAASE